jgi:hypothetical protein
VSGEPDSRDPRGRAAVEFPVTVLERIRAEYEEAPGLHLTLAQAGRFLGLDRSVCQGAFDELENAGFLTRGAGGTYRRST